MNKPLWEVGDLVQIRLDDFRAELGLAIVLKVHTAAGDGIHYLVSEGKTNATQWLRETVLSPVVQNKNKI
tara:strand:- start:425 stop:634 length:210 start_codon:yes stop_codon:yes gene_type:complete